MPDLGQPVPAEEEQTDHGRFQEEGHQAFDGERRAEHVADIMRVIGPVGAELEFHGDAGGDPHGEVDAEQRAPELRHVAPDGAAGHHIDALHDDEDQRQAQRQRHEQEVIERGGRELQAREQDDVHGYISVPTMCADVRGASLAVGWLKKSTNRAVNRTSLTSRTAPISRTSPRRGIGGSGESAAAILSPPRRKAIRPAEIGTLVRLPGTPCYSPENRETSWPSRNAGSRSARRCLSRRAVMPLSSATGTTSPASSTASKTRSTPTVRCVGLRALRRRRRTSPTSCSFWPTISASTTSPSTAAAAASPAARWRRPGSIPSRARA